MTGEGRGDSEELVAWGEGEIQMQQFPEIPNATALIVCGGRQAAAFFDSKAISLL